MNKTIATIVAAGTLISGGVDASILNENVAPVAVKLAGNDVVFKQENNVAETTFPWKDQPGIKVKYDLGEPTVAEKLKDKRDKNILVETVDFGEGGFKIDIILDKNPATNRFCYQIEGWENYDFFYQPALTAEEIAQGASRPEEIVGSYAVYHKQLRDHRLGSENYATGKVMHIPFPYVWEIDNATATKQRAENLEYQNGELCVTVQQDFLDKAKYPVRVDPTFGYTSAGASNTLTSNNIVGSVFALAENGLVSSVTANGLGASEEICKVSGVYSTSYNLYGANNLELCTYGLQSWKTHTYTSPFLLTPGDYWIVVSGNSGLGSGALYYDAGTTNQGLVVTYIYTATVPNSFSSPTLNNNKYSIYATYDIPPPPGYSTSMQNGLIIRDGVIFR